MEKTKKNNKKLIVAVCVLCVCLIAAIGAIFGVYAATQQNISTSFSVKYSVGDNVAIKATAYIYDHSTYDYDDYFYETNNTKIEELYSVQYNVDNSSIIKSADGTVLSAIPAQNCTLTSEQRTVNFVYELENLGENDIVLEIDWIDYFNFLTSGSTDNIYNCKFSFIDGDFIGAANISVEEFIHHYGAGWDEDVMVPECGLQADYAVTISGGEKYYIAVAIGVEDVNKSALCKSEEDTGLTFIFTDADNYT